MYWQDKPATSRQREVLYELLPPERWSEVPTMKRGDAHDIISRAYKEPWRKRALTPAQVRFLQRYNLWNGYLNRGAGADIIAGAKAEEARSPGFLDQLLVRRVVPDLEALRQKGISLRLGNGGPPGPTSSQD